jgi:hypothetical protein
MQKWVIIFGLLILLAVTNPSKADFVAWAEQQAVEQSDGLIEKGLAYLAAGTWADSLTNTKDYLIVSTYTMLMPNGEEMTFVGVLGKFFPIGHINSDGESLTDISIIKVVGFFVIALIALRLLRRLLKTDSIKEGM